VIEPGARAAIAATRNKRIAVIATEGTVKGEAYPRAIHALKGEMSVVQRPCQVFVALAEEGWTDSSVTTEAAKNYLGSLFEGAAAPDPIVLGCTHFPVLASAIRQVIGKDGAIVDSAENRGDALGSRLQSRRVPDRRRPRPAAVAVQERLGEGADDCRYAEGQRQTRESSEDKQLPSRAVVHLPIGIGPWQQDDE